MNKALLRSHMAKFSDTQEALAASMSLSLSRFNAKLNERGGAAFTQSEMSFIIERYQLSGDEAMAVFFTQKVAETDTLEN